MVFVLDGARRGIRNEPSPLGKASMDPAVGAATVVGGDRPEVFPELGVGEAGRTLAPANLVVEVAAPLLDLAERVGAGPGTLGAGKNGGWSERLTP